MTAQRRGRTWLPVVIMVLALLAGLVVVDRVGEEVAEARAAAALTERFSLTSRPTVEIESFPFLPQLVSSTYGRVRIEGDDVTLATSGRTLSVEHLTAQLRKVRLDRNSIRIGSVTGSAALSWAGVSRAAHGAQVSFAGTDNQGRGRVHATADVTIVKQKVTFELTGRPTLDASRQVITLADATVRLEGGVTVPPHVVDLVVDQLVGKEALALPLGLRATGLTVDPAGMRLDLAGTDVTVSSP